jgi:hypothetical protein
MSKYKSQTFRSKKNSFKPMVSTEPANLIFYILMDLNWFIDVIWMGLILIHDGMIRDFKFVYDVFYFLGFVIVFYHFFTNNP